MGLQSQLFTICGWYITFGGYVQNNSLEIQKVLDIYLDVSGAKVNHEKS